MKIQQLYLLLALALLLVVGCTPRTEQGGEETGSETEATAETEETNEEPEEEVETNGEPIKIGFFSPVTGPLAQAGTVALQSAQLAVEQINESGGVLGRPLELIHYDDHMQPDQAASIARKLVEQDKVVAAVSGSLSGMTRAAAPVFQEIGIPMVSAYAVHPEITATGDRIFRVGTLADVQGRVGAELVGNNLGAKKVAILAMDNDFGIALVDGFKARAEELGLEIVFEERFPLGETEFRPLINKLRNADADVVYHTGYYSEGANFVNQLRDEGLEIQVVGQEGFDSPIFLELGGEAAEGVIITTDLDRDSEREATKAYIEGFRAKYNEEPDMVGASAFDAIQVLATAIEKAGSTEPDAIVTAISNLKDVENVASGPFHYYTENREVVRPIGAQIVRDGEFHFYAEFDDPELIVP